MSDGEGGCDDGMASCSLSSVSLPLCCIGIQEDSVPSQCPH